MEKKKKGISFLKAKLGSISFMSSSCSHILSKTGNHKRPCYKTGKDAYIPGNLRPVDHMCLTCDFHNSKVKRFSKYSLIDSVKSANTEHDHFI